MLCRVVFWFVVWYCVIFICCIVILLLFDVFFYYSVVCFGRFVLIRVFLLWLLWLCFGHLFWYSFVLYVVSLYCFRLCWFILILQVLCCVVFFSVVFFWGWYVILCCFDLCLICVVFLYSYIFRYFVFCYLWISFALFWNMLCFILNFFHFV